MIIKDYQELTGKKNAFKIQADRMNIIYQGIKKANSIFEDIESKIGIWIANDPTLVIDDSTLSPALILTYVPRWPLIVNLLSACFCFGCSALFHQF